MDGGPTTAQRRVLVVLLALAALSLPLAGALTAFPGEAEWFWSDRLSLAGNAASAGSIVLLVLALVVASVDGGGVLVGEVRVVVALAGVVVAATAGWLGLSLLADLGLFAGGLPDGSAAMTLSRRVAGVAVGLTAVGAGLVAWWSATSSERGADRG